MNTLVVIAHHNGMQYLDALLPSLGLHPVLVVDTGSTGEDLAYLQSRLLMKEFIPGGGCVAAYEHAFRKYAGYDAYLFLHDSLVAKMPDYLAAFEAHGDVCAWIGFPMDYDAAQADYLKQFYDLGNPPPTAIFGPIFYATRRAMESLADKKLLPPHPQNRFELCALERGYAFAFHQAGFRVEYLEEYSNERLDIDRDYQLFDKFRPGRT